MNANSPEWGKVKFKCLRSNPRLSWLVVLFTQTSPCLFSLPKSTTSTFCALKELKKKGLFVLFCFSDLQKWFSNLTYNIFSARGQSTLLAARGETACCVFYAIVLVWRTGRKLDVFELTFLRSSPSVWERKQESARLVVLFRRQMCARVIEKRETRVAFPLFNMYHKLFHSSCSWSFFLSEFESVWK